MSLPPDYLIVIDLEASGTDTYNVNRSEITEWPWVVYDLRSRIIVDAKQVFIAPQWSPNPNPTPDQVANLNTDVAFSPSLKDAVAKFDAYLYSSFALQNKTFCLLADGPWDLRHLLLLEAARKAVSLAPHFRTFFNLRTEFERCYPGAPAPADRQHLVDYLAIHPASSKTGGLASCHVMANIVARLQQDNHVFATPEVIPEFDWAAMSVRVPAIAVPVAAAVPVGGIVRLRGLPWTCVEQDIVDFFVGIPIVPKGIHFVKNAHGKATGEAFVQLHVIESVQHALQRHKQMMGRRYIEVFKSNPVDMSNHLGRADARRQLHQQQVLHAQAHKAAAAAAANAANAAEDPERRSVCSAVLDVRRSPDGIAWRSLWFCAATPRWCQCRNSADRAVPSPAAATARAPAESRRTAPWECARQRDGSGVCPESPQSACPRCAGRCCENV
jgi:RNA recognition motif. (a.k.a. RRM, RBD, or RNP domain)